MRDSDVEATKKPAPVSAGKVRTITRNVIEPIMRRSGIIVNRVSGTAFLALAVARKIFRLPTVAKEKARAVRVTRASHCMFIVCCADDGQKVIRQRECRQWQKFPVETVFFSAPPAAVFPRDGR